MSPESPRSLPTASPARLRGGVILAVLPVLLLSLAWLGAQLESVKRFTPAFTRTEALQQKVNRTPFAVILGQFRTGVSDLLWVKTEYYLHRGVGFEPHLTGDDLTEDEEHNDQDSHPEDKSVIHDDHEEPDHAVAKLATGHIHDEHCDHEYAVSEDTHVHTEHCDHESNAPAMLIPDAERDYRGWIGTLHRSIQPWQSADAPHEHTGGEELLPWYRVLTAANPHHTRAYITGAWWLTKQHDHEGALAEALAFVDEGIHHNPDAFALHLLRGRILLQMERFPEAVDSCDHAARLAVRIRPPGGKPTEPVWTESDEEDFMAAARLAVLIPWRKLNDAASTRAALHWALEHLPGDPTLMKIHAELEASAELSRD